MRLVFIACVVSALMICTYALPDGWSTAGCLSDDPASRTLMAASYFDPTFSTQEACIEFCDERHYTFAGAEFGRECYCDNLIHNNAIQHSTSDCNITCPFDSAENCGGSDRLSLFTKSTGPILVLKSSGDALPGVWNYVGSFNNTTPDSAPFNVEAVIAETQTTSGTVENCLDWCFQDFGCSLCSVSDGGVCECGNTLSPNRVTANTGQALCQRNSSEICGDTGVWQVYQFTPNAT